MRKQWTLGPPKTALPLGSSLLGLKKSDQLASAAGICVLDPLRGIQPWIERPEKTRATAWSCAPSHGRRQVILGLVVLLGCSIKQYVERT